MIDIDHAINVAKLLITTAESLSTAIDKAKQAIDAGAEQLRGALAEAEKMQAQLAADRRTADDSLDRKFDASNDAV